MNRANDKKYFKQQLNKFVQQLKRNENISVDASNNEDIRLAFAEAIRTFKNNNLFGTDKHAYIILEDLNGTKKHLPLRAKTSTQLVERILGEVTTTQDASDSQEYINSSFIPVIFHVKFYDRNSVRNNDDLGDEIDLRELHDGEFWRYINLSVSFMHAYSQKFSQTKRLIIYGHMFKHESFQTNLLKRSQKR